MKVWEPAVLLRGGRGKEATDEVLMGAQGGLNYISPEIAVP